MPKTRKQKVLAQAGAANGLGPVDCLGMTFATDDARRAFFLEKLGERLKDPAFRKIEGFPLGDDEDILRLSDPPYYTACPNPFLEDFIKQGAKPLAPGGSYTREPQAIDVTEGKTDPIYTAHSYHTKVPHKAIMRAILHYTDPGDLILDGFAGTGMTGVAAQTCRNPEADFRQTVETEWKVAGHGSPSWGSRRVILNDLSPAATFIAANYNLPLDLDAFDLDATKLLADLEEEVGWMYETRHGKGKATARINFMVWSEVFGCPECGREIVFSEVTLDPRTKKTHDSFHCPGCKALLDKDKLTRLYESVPDPATGKPWRRFRLRPVLINYTVAKQRFEKAPDDDDLALLQKVEAKGWPPEIPTNAFDFASMWEAPRLRSRGISHTHHLFLPRQAQALGALWRAALGQGDCRRRNMLLFFAEQAIWGMSLLARYAPTHFSQVNQYLSGALYVGSQIAEVSPWYILQGKQSRLTKTFRAGWMTQGNLAVSTGACGSLLLPDGCIDYVFTDPPFGDNFPYAELNYLVESWHRVTTDARTEAIVDRSKENKSLEKGLPEYQSLMERCFAEYYRVLKPGRWMTVVFSNSKNAVWIAIQEALGRAGFVVADVRSLDKQQRTLKQISGQAVKQDLVISAYKPNGGLEERFKLKGGSEEGAWDFVRTHLRHLPVFVVKEGEVEVIAERQANLLYDRMVAFHVLRGVMLPLSAAECFNGLAARFPERDGMYFLAEQVAEYDKKRLAVRGVRQLDLFVHDEASAIEWIRKQLMVKPQPLQDLTPIFMREIAGKWEKYEKLPELVEVLRFNFLRYDGTEDVPDQIRNYLSKNFKDLRGLGKDNKQLRARGKDRWYVPDPGKAGDLEKLREKELLQEFWEYLPPGYVPTKQEDAEGYLPGLEPKSSPVAPGRKMKQVRLEAVRAGFKYCWQNRDYKTIIAVAQRIPEDVLQQDPKLLMWYDQASTRSGAV